MCTGHVFQFSFSRCPRQCLRKSSLYGNYQWVCCHCLVLFLLVGHQFYYSVWVNDAVSSLWIGHTSQCSDIIMRPRDMYLLLRHVSGDFTASSPSYCTKPLGDSARITNADCSAPVWIIGYSVPAGSSRLMFSDVNFQTRLSQNLQFCMASLLFRLPRIHNASN